MSELVGKAAMVVGAGRGLGRGIADAFADAGASVVAVARSRPEVAELAAANVNIRAEAADAADAQTASDLLDRYKPAVVVLVAGAVPVMGRLQDQTWETFSVNWHADVKIAFHWLQAALTKPLAPGGRVVVVSSGAAVKGSPASGGYAGAKATQRFLADYARVEAQRAGLDVTVTVVLPAAMTPFGAVGRQGIQAYAARSGQSEDAFVKQLGDLLTPELAGAALVELLQTDPADTAAAYLLTSNGLKPA
ncbi:SDR family oxidoreductase [Streptomyces sp. NBC_00286]|uniref:SDR family oxidoreductase n=1 Tax=Streptomyces sp. NBC_00286 TaxID=2975701 RepID=UPI002E2AF6A7|nr:SDR family oxidoreductase [Streptomyces sp. NBC_00286]